MRPYTTLKEISVPDNFLQPQWNVGGISKGYAEFVNFDKASGYVDPLLLEAQQFGGSRLAMSMIVPGGVYEFGSGTVLAPGIRWAADTDTGFYLIGTANVGASVGGDLVWDWNATRLRLDAGFSLQIADLTPGRVVFVGTSEELADDAEFTYNSTTNFLTVDGLNLVDTSNQLVFQSAGVTGTITWTPATSGKTVTMQNLTGVMALQNASTLTDTQLLFSNSTGLIVQDAGLSFDGVTLTISDSNATTTPLEIWNQASTGDSAVRWSLGTTISYAMGIDNSVAGDPFVLSTAASGTAVLGTGNIMSITAAGVATFAALVATTSITDNGLTSGRVVIASTSGLLADDADLTFSTATLTATNLIVTTALTNSALTAGRVVIASTAGLLADDAGLTYNATTDVLTLLGTSAGLTLAYDGSNFLAVTIDSIGRVRHTLTGTGSTVRTIASVNAPFSCSVENVNAGASAEATLGISTSGSGDSAVTVSAGGVTWMHGVDQSQASRFAIAKVAGLGTVNDVLRITTDGAWSYIGQAVSTGAATEFTHQYFNWSGGAITFTTGADITTQRTVRFGGATYAATGATQVLTNAATVYIEAQPTAGTNVSITNPYALWVDDGAVRFDGWLNVGATVRATSAGQFSAGGASGAGATSIHWNSSGHLITYGSTGNAYILLSSEAGTPSVHNEDGHDIDFRVEGDNDPNLFFCDASTDRIGLGISTPQVFLAVAGGVVAIGSFTASAAGSRILQINHASPGLSFYNSSGAVDEKYYDFLASGSKFEMQLINDAYSLATSVFAVTRSSYNMVSFVINDSGVDSDFRVESDDESYCLFVEGTLNNVVLCANTEPGFNSMDGGVFLDNANVVPVGNAATGGYLYAEGGSLKWRSSGGTTTTIAT